MDAFASVISNNLNRVMKSLTSVTIVFMLPTLIASIFGMNVDLPFNTHNPLAFIIILAVAVAISLLTVAYLIKRKIF